MGNTGMNAGNALVRDETLMNRSCPRHFSAWEKLLPLETRLENFPGDRASSRVMKQVGTIEKTPDNGWHREEKSFFNTIAAILSSPRREEQSNTKLTMPVHGPGT